MAFADPSEQPWRQVQRRGLRGLHRHGASGGHRRDQGGSATKNIVSGILWRVVSTGRAFWLYQLAGSAAADRAGNSPKRAAYQYTNRTCNRSTNGCTCSRTCHDAAADQNGLRLPFGLLGIEAYLSCSVRILGRNTMSRNCLLGKVWVNRFYACRLSGG